jgi:hypothetical protein
VNELVIVATPSEIRQALRLSCRERCGAGDERCVCDRMVAEALEDLDARSPDLPPYVDLAEVVV